MGEHFSILNDNLVVQDISIMDSWMSHLCSSLYITGVLLILSVLNTPAG